jgi:hypothetical protein
MDASETLLDEICRHCNNYFNAKNDPKATEREYPASFMELAGRIAAFVKTDDGDSTRSNVTAMTAPSGGMTFNLEYSSWQKAFARDLSIWKRVRFL